MGVCFFNVEETSKGNSAIYHFYDSYYVKINKRLGA